VRSLKKGESERKKIPNKRESEFSFGLLVLVLGGMFLDGVEAFDKRRMGVVIERIERVGVHITEVTAMKAD